MSAISDQSFERAVAPGFVLSPLSDYLLILAPFWLGAFYLAAVNLVPSARPIVFFVFLALLGETHFGATGLFLTARENRAWIWRNRRLLVYAPLALVGAFASIGIWDLRLALLVGSIASGIHVARQSIGVSRLYGSPRNGLNEFSIYGASAGFLGVGFARFYAPALPLPPTVLEMIVVLTPLAEAALLLGIGVCLFLVGDRSGYDRRFFAALTGCAIYAPYCFVSDPRDAIAIGVAMHWCQYLALNAAVYGRWAIATGGMKRLALAPVVIIAYGVAMATIHPLSPVHLSTAKILVLLPLCGEFVHYYIDAFIWRFSDPHIRKSVGAYIWNRR